MTDNQSDPSDIDLEDLVGSLINGIYLLEDLLGKGGMGAVFRAMHLRDHRQVAIKIIAPELVSDDKDYKRFLREARLGLMLSHPNIVRVYEFGETPQRLLFMVMDYVEGTSLADLLEAEAPFAPARVLELLKPLCDALDYAHGRNILHRDLKPANIVITKDNAGRESARLLDFGIMKLLTSDDQMMSYAALTETNVVLGTPDYMSPEQLMNLSLKSTADVYSVGVILYQMFTGDLPIEYFDFSELLMLKVYKDAPPPSARFSFIHPAIEEVVMKSIARDPEQRYQSAGELYRSCLKAVYQLPSNLQQPDAATLAKWRAESGKK